MGEYRLLPEANHWRISFIYSFLLKKQPKGMIFDSKLRVL